MFCRRRIRERRVPFLSVVHGSGYRNTKEHKCRTTRRPELRRENPFPQKPQYLSREYSRFFFSGRFIYSSINSKNVTAKAVFLGTRNTTIKRQMYVENI